MSLTKNSLAGNNFIIPRHRGVWLATSRLGTGKSLPFFTVYSRPMCSLAFREHSRLGNMRCTVHHARLILCNLHSVMYSISAGSYKRQKLSRLVCALFCTVGSPALWKPEAVRAWQIALNTTNTLCQKLETNIPRNDTARSRSQFPHSCIYARLKYSHDRSAYFANEVVQFYFQDYINWILFAVCDVSSRFLQAIVHTTLEKPALWNVQ